MKFIFSIIASLFLLAFLSACGENTKSPAAGILVERSGVWRAKNDGTLVSIIYSEKKVRLLFGEDSLPVSLGDVDNTNKTANLNVTLIGGKPGVWTIRQIWDKEKTTFHLQLTLHDGTQDDLSFVRKISTDDLNKIANAEARAQSGSLGDAGKMAEATGPTAPTVPIVAPLPEQTAIAPDTKKWMPSFDCAKVTTGPERLICSSEELSAADVRLSQAYKAAASVSTDKEALKSTQNLWRKFERDACSDVQCMLTAYQNRLLELTH